MLELLIAFVLGALALSIIEALEQPVMAKIATKEAGVIHYLIAAAISVVNGVKSLFTKKAAPTK